MAGASHAQGRKPNTMLTAIRYALWALVFIAAAVIGSRMLLSPQAQKSAFLNNASSPLGSPFQLIDHTGAPITEKALAGHPVALFFGYTHCPDVCPTTLFELALWLRELGEEARDVRAFFITVDPARDAAPVMHNYVTAFTDRIVGITGDAKQIADLARSWRVIAKKVLLEDEDYTIDHTASIFLVRRDGSLLGTIAVGEDRQTAMDKLRRLARGS